MKYYEDEHVTLYLGDCREIMPQLESEAFHAVITDPPYAVDKRGEMLGQISANYHEKGTHSRGYADHDPGAFRDLLMPAFTEASRVLMPGRFMLSFGGTRTIHQATSFAEQVGFTAVDQLAFIGGGTYAKSKTTLVPAYEPAALLRKPGNPWEVNPARNVQNVLTSMKRGQASDHPTTKPASWMNWSVALLARQGEQVIDPFAGSGSTLVAAKAAGVKAVGIEQYESFCEMAAKRLQQGAFDLGAIA